MKPPTNKALVEVLHLLDSLGALNLVKRYAAGTHEALHRWLYERCRTIDAEAEPGDRQDKLLVAPERLENGDFVRGLPEWVVSLAWSRGNSYDWPKSRGTRCTLSHAGCSLNEALFVGGSRIYIVSETDEKSKDIIEKITFMWNHLDDKQSAQLKPLWEVESYVDHLKIVKFCGKPHDSFIHGLPQGASSFRQYGGSVVWIDEAGVQPWFLRLLQGIGPRARRIICTGTLLNPPYTKRCDSEVLRSFDGPELSGVLKENPEMVREA